MYCFNKYYKVGGEIWCFTKKYLASTEITLHLIKLKKPPNILHSIDTVMMGSGQNI